ncbi:dioxygenase-like protein [Kribbella steppae]|uniref:Dioxygenase-like protein n=1 Tax=Kribbella steppae TaxID=2512223 RepID=A0A4R2H7S0_9ACTN|nr:hypothetical protein [Kribbella steppae]TCO22299.1 dioxygenase-like protein [Kribbella steppae]
MDTSDGSKVAGTAFTLVLHILQVGERACTPLPGATVDIWHCDAAGIYSDIAAEGTTGKNFLRGYQVTNRGGIVKFTTVLPGWYQGRTVHTHVKVQTTGTDGNPYEFTSQIYFTEEFKAAYRRVHRNADGLTAAPSPGNPGARASFSCARRERRTCGSSGRRRRR